MARSLSAADLAGLVGVLLMLGAYAGSQTGRLDPRRFASLIMNLVGSCLVIISLLHSFNLSSFLIEAAWAVIALGGLMRLALRRRRG
jgi:hypothetical protein